jgi:acyl carrier protein
MLTDASDTVRSIILRSIVINGGRAKTAVGEIGDECKLLELGLIDSEDLVDIILEVEEQCRCEFNPEAVDVANGLTLKGLISAFVPKG